MAVSRKLNTIFSDLKWLLEEDVIKAKDFKVILGNVKSREVINYLSGLSEGSKPEQILREVFFTFNAELSKFFFKNIYPEVNQESGFIDYLIKENREEISIEVKPLFITNFKREKAGKIFVQIKKRKLKVADHKTQIMKYLQDKRDYVVLTNLEDWYFFSKASLIESDCKPFAYITLFDLIKEFKQVDDFWQYLDKKEDLNVKEPLDVSFFRSLKSWVTQLSEIEFKLNGLTKTKLIINLVNKFIFIQSLDNFWVVSKNYIGKEWENIERKWTAKNKKRILKKYLEDINEYFYELYDTELFKIAESNKTILDFINESSTNIELFYEKLKLILGIEYGKSPVAWVPGIIQFNFRRIDEDILGKSYETFLAEIRKEQGIYYTPKYITQYITNNTVDNYFKVIIKNFRHQLQAKDYEACMNLIQEMFSFKVIDPACGSGSFLIKALKIIFKNYSEINTIIESVYIKFSDFKGKIKRSDKIEEEFQKVLKLKNLLNFEEKRKLISDIIIRHIHGVDLDINAIEVAKLNLWLEAIKLAPKDFQFDKVPADTNHILPDLEMNLCNGDSLVGISNQIVVDFLIDKFPNELHDLNKLRVKYIDNPAKIELVKEIVNIKLKIREELDKVFHLYLEENDIDLEIINRTKSFYWPLDFWFVYFDDSIKSLSRENIGFNSVIGNPPYFTIRGKGTGTLTKTYSYQYLKKAKDWKNHFRSQSDIYYYFIIKSIDLLKTSGNFGFIIESYWIENDYADKLKQYLLDNVSIKILINFGRVKKIFEDADNDTCILIFEKIIKDDNKIKYIYCNKNYIVGTQQQNNLKLLSHIVDNIEKIPFSDEYIDNFWVIQKNLGVSKWVLSNKTEILRKIEANKILLGDLCKIGQGVVPGRKKEFRISPNESRTTAGGYWIKRSRDHLNVINKKNDTEYRLEIEFVKPLITNSRILKYRTIPDDEYLIYTVPFQEERKNIDDYPGIFEYLKVYAEELSERYDYVEDEEVQKYPWFGYQRVQNVELFENSGIKILCPYRALENRFALDQKGYFGTTDMYALVPKADSKINLNYLLGLLNSRLLTFWYREAGKSKGLILEFFATPLSKMPIASIPEEKQEEIGSLISEISGLHKLKYEFEQTWHEISQQYRNGTITFEKLILDDRIKIQNGEFEKLWISNIKTFPLGEGNNQTRKFQSFLVFGGKKNSFQVYGVLDKKEVLILDIETTQKEFRDIIYLEVFKLLNSRKIVNTLKDILSKTIISTIKPNIWEKSSNLLKYTKAKFEKWKLQNEIVIELEDLILIDEKIQEIEIEVETLVFEIYAISRKDITTILDITSTYKNMRDKILNNIK